jgi:hypothetical protein
MTRKLAVVHIRVTSTTGGPGGIERSIYVKGRRVPDYPWEDESEIIR